MSVHLALVQYMRVAQWLACVAAFARDCPVRIVRCPVLPEVMFRHHGKSPGQPQLVKGWGKAGSKGNPGTVKVWAQESAGYACRDFIDTLAPHSPSLPLCPYFQAGGEGHP
jgi:hypothetical protein